MYIKFLSYILLLRITPCTEKIIGIFSVDFHVIDQLLILYSAFFKYLRINGSTKASASPIYRIQRAYDSLRGEVLYSNLNYFGIHVKIVTLTKVCLKETCNRVRVGRYVSDTFPVKNG